MRVDLECLFLQTVFMLAVPGVAQQTAPQPAPVPDAAAVEAGRNVARELFGDRFRQAANVEGKLALVMEMIAVAARLEDGSPDQYAMLTIARDIAAGAGEVPAAIKATEQLAERFDVPVAKLKADLLITAARRAGASSQHKAVAEFAMSIAMELAAAGDFGSAIELCEAGRAAADKAKLEIRGKELAARAVVFRERQQAIHIYQEALTVLADTPTDPAANLAAGRYLCFVQADWERGIPMLDRGSDAELKAVASLDLRGATSGDDQVAVGDAWWHLAESRHGREQDMLRNRAGFWYQQAEPNLPAGLAKVKVEHRLGMLSKAKVEVETPPPSAPSTLDPFASRRLGQRQEFLERGGGNAASEAAVAAALRWIVDHQLPDGGWSFDHRIGSVVNGRPRTSDHPGTQTEARRAATAMAILPLLGAGYTNKEGQYSAVVQGGLEYLSKNMKAQGALDEPQGNLYSHGLASIALCEAYGMTNDPALMRFAQASLNFIAYAQDPRGGGWRYQPRQAGDTSVLGWQVMALSSGEMSQLKVSPLTLRGANKFLDTVQADKGAFYGYTSPGKGPATTAIGLLCRVYLGWKQDHQAFKRGVQWISEQGPSMGGSANMYYNYYATQVCRQYGDEVWDKWNAKMRDFLISSQAKDGPAQGSWFFSGGHGAEAGGRLYNTSLATMVLEAYYRPPQVHVPATSAIVPGKTQPGRALEPVRKDPRGVE